ncbi:MAG: hypothetical protein IT201_01895 [Thermoleophilia bacterium]|nr:hypothetical protein [Thermoleophilia bacterium]
MTSHVVRLYALALTLAVFFLLWAAIAARPWQEHGPSRDPRLNALAAREQRLQILAARVSSAPRSAEDAIPAVELTALPPVTETRSS